MELTVQGRAAYAYTGGKAFDAARPTVVFIHGAQHDHSVWVLQTRWFAHHGHGVLAVDLPGHGRSAGPALASVEAMADWVLALLDAAGARGAVHWVGHSMGSLIALQAGGDHPERAASLALLGTAVPMKVSDALLSATRTDEAAAIDMINIWSHNGYLQKPQHPAPGFWTVWGNKRLMHRQAPGVLHTDFAACNAYAQGAAQAAKLRCPVLVMNGVQDVMTPARAAAAFAATIPGSRFVALEQCGHSLCAEQPDAVLDHLADFLRERRSSAEPRAA